VYIIIKFQNIENEDKNLLNEEDIKSTANKERRENIYIKSKEGNVMKICWKKFQENPSK
jgi:hypothetical protein